MPAVLAAAAPKAGFTMNRNATPTTTTLMPMPISPVSCTSAPSVNIAPAINTVRLRLIWSADLPAASAPSRAPQRDPARHHFDQQRAERERPFDAVERAGDHPLVVTEQPAGEEDDHKHHDQPRGQGLTG